MKFRTAALILLSVCLPGCTDKSGSARQNGNNDVSTMPLAAVSGGSLQSDETGFEPSPNSKSMAGESGSEIVPVAVHGKPAAGPLHVLAWNVESGASNPKVISSQLGEYRGLEIVVLTEVLPTEFENFRAAIHAGEGAEYASVNGQTGDEDRVELIFNKSKLELLQSEEPNDMGGMAVNTGRHRSPLVCLFQDRTGGEKFYVVGVHLARGDSEFRKQQSIAIREWARDRLEAVILVGDLNFDFVFADDRGNEAFEELQRDNIMKWVRPVELIDSNWYDANGDGLDDYPGSLLDGVYVSGPAKAWSPKCRILVREGDFPDNGETSDHRPISLELVPGELQAGK